MKNLILTYVFLLFAIAGIIAQDLSIVGNGNGVERSISKRDFEIKDALSLYPNPAVENIYVNLKKSELKNVVFELHTLLGNQLTISPVEIAPNTYKIPVETLPVGYYYLVVKDEVIRFEKGYKILKK